MTTVDSSPADSGSNFLNRITLQDGGCIGKGKLAYEARVLSVWISQAGDSGDALAAASASQVAKGGWTITMPRVGGKNLVAGPALASALALVVDDDEERVIEWSMPVTLETN
jgi:hypothetical protein